MAGFAEFGLGLDQMHRLVAAVPIMTKQAFAGSYIGMRLLDGLAMFPMATVAGFGLRLGQEGIVRCFMEGDVAFAATFILVRLVGISHAIRTNQIVMAAGAGLRLNENGFAARLMGIVAEAAFHVLIVGVRRGGDGRVHLLCMAGATQFGLGVPQNGGIVGTMREMAEIAFFLSNLRMRLHHGAAMFIMAGVACLGDGSLQHFGVGSGMGRVASDALAILEGLMPMRHR